jgi:hypothetical protein
MQDDQTATVAFLRAEEVATRLTDELTRLDTESQRYSGAAATLEGAGEKLRSLADAVKTSGERTSEVMTAIQGVGTPAIIDGLEHVGVSVRDSLVATEKAWNAITKMEAANAVTQKSNYEAIAAVRSTLVEMADGQSRQIRVVLLISVCAAVLAGVACIVPFFR